MPNPNDAVADTFQKDLCSGSAMKTLNSSGGSVTLNSRVARPMLQFIREYNATVEPINAIGGYNCRDIRSTGKASFHAYGLAVDINAGAHPYGASGTFTSGELASLEKLLSSFPQITWGGTWSTPDEMHFQWGGSGSGFPSLGSMTAGLLPDWITDLRNFLNAFDNFVRKMLDRTFWIRVGMFVGGGLLLLLAFLVFFPEVEKTFQQRIRSKVRELEKRKGGESGAGAERGYGDGESRSDSVQHVHSESS